jgi:type II secretory pathway component GspD/PulD (secretin)
LKATTYIGVVLATFAAFGVHAQDVVEVIQLRHRTAEQVISVLRPLVDSGGALTGQFNQLIVRTTPANLAQIRAVLASIDQPARRLMISVRYDSTENLSASGIESDVRLSNRGSSANVRIEDSRSAANERVDQRIQVLEGGRAMISAGESRPLSQRQVIRTPGGGTVVQDSVVMQDAATGYEVMPRVAGSTVTLEVAQQRQNFSGAPGALQSDRVASTVSGRLGDWIELGGADIVSSRQGSGILSSRDAASGGSRRVWVKVEEIR